MNKDLYGADNIDSYLGDGVYVTFDGYNIWLLANNKDYPTDRICLDPSVIQALIRFAERMGGK
jgi:hypothetical protein